MKEKKIIKGCLATALVFGSVSGVTGCFKYSDKDSDAKQLEIYQLYLKNMADRGENPLTYEEWLVSIKGEKGDKGDPGDDGLTPIITIGQNGNWFVDGVDTGRKAQGEKGDDGYVPAITIGQNGNWFVDGVDTGRKAQGEKGDTGSMPTITIGQNGNWFIDGVDTGTKAQGEKGETGDYVEEVYYDITYSYQSVGAGEIFDNYKDTQKVTPLEWLTDLPKPKGKYISDFDGWYIEGTDIKVETYDFIGGDVTLVDRWHNAPVVPAGLYQNNQLAMTWDQIVAAYPEAFRKQNSTIMENDNVGPITSYFKDLEGDLVISSNIEEIGDHAFWDCKNLTSIELPESLTTIGHDAFHNCDNLTSIEIPSSVTTIGEEAFGDCDNLTEIIVDENNNNYSSKDGVLFNKDQTKLMQYPARKTLESYTIPSTVTIIGDGAFYNCDNLTSIELPQGLITIGDGAFAYCDNLTSIELPESLTRIGYRVFYGCGNLTSIELPESLTTIGYNVFYNCDNLTKVVIDCALSAETVSNSYLLKYATVVYTSNTLSDENVSYLEGEFTKQATSDMTGYNKWVKNS